MIATGSEQLSCTDVHMIPQSTEMNPSLPLEPAPSSANGDFKENVMNEEMDRIHSRLTQLEIEITNLRQGYIVVNERYNAAMESLRLLTTQATEAAKGAEAAAQHFGIASKSAAVVANDVAEKSVVTVAERATEAADTAAEVAAEAAASVAAAATAAAAVVAEAAAEAAASAAAATTAAAAAVAHQTEESALQTSAQAAAAVKLATESAAEATKMAHAASASAKKARE